MSGKGGVSTRTPAIGNRPLTIRLGSVATRSVAATTNGTPAEVGNTSAMRRRSPRAARMKSTTLEPTPSGDTRKAAGVDEVRGCRVGFYGQRLRKRVGLADQRHQPVVP